ncbi:MAG: hypothetical protein M0Z38_02460 [Deltaproteobacteria bacterium]|nr:hypothetical protein [Deltaproteobacteria bacterium]
MAVMREDISFPVLFALSGLRHGSGSWVDYEKGKGIIRDTFPDDYERGIEELTEYLQV